MKNGGMALRRPRARFASACFALQAAVIGGCGTGLDSVDGQTERRDSAGVSLVEVKNEPWKSVEWSLASKPSLQIGVAEGDPSQELSAVVNARRLADGRIIVANSGTGEIRTYRTDGQLERSCGRFGKGPGEFSELSWIQTVNGDTVFAWDIEGPRFTAFSRNCEIVSTVNIQVGRTAPWPPGDFRLKDGGLLLVWTESSVMQRIRSGEIRPGRTERNIARIVHYTATGVPLDTIAVVPGFEEAVFESEPDGRRSATFPLLGRVTVFAAGGQGIYVGTQDAHEIREYSVPGALVRVFRWSGPDLTIGEADIDAWKAPMRSGYADAASWATADRFLQTLPLPPGRPAYGRLLLDAGGNIWISEPVNPVGSPVRWAVLNSRDGFVGQLSVPERFDLYEVGEDYVLGRFRDDADIEYIRQYRLLRKRGPPPA